MSGHRGLYDAVGGATVWEFTLVWLSLMGGLVVGIGLGWWLVGVWSRW